MGTLSMNSSSFPYHRIRIRKPVVNLSSQDIDDMLMELRRQRASWTPVNRAAQTGDQLIVVYTGEVGKQKVVDNGKQPVTIILGPGLSSKILRQSLTGAHPGDRITLAIKHRDKDPDPSLAGKRVSYEYHIIDVREEKIPSLNKAFARSLGIASGSIADLRKQLKGTLQQQIGNFVRRSVREQLLEGLLSIHSGDLSSQLTTKEREAALSSIMQQIIRNNVITIDMDKVNAAINAIAATSEDPDSTAREYYSRHKLFSSVEASVLENQVLDFVMQQARVTETSVSYKKIRQQLADPSTTVKQQQLPVISLTPETKCGFCVRSCCTYITQCIDAPRSKSDFSHLLWQVSHHQVEAFRDKRVWYLLFRTDCQHLLPDGRCGNYEHRMSICRKHSNRYCEFDGTADESYDLHFRDYDSLLRYCKRRFKHWEY